MSDNKKYYYLKLKEDFFDSEEIKVLESMDNGYKYSNILLKMYLRSLKREGLLAFNDKIPYNPKMIATVTGHNANDVKQALVLFQQLGLIDVLSNGIIYMLDIQNFIGRSTTEADRIRAYRNKIEEQKQSLLSGGCTNVQDIPYKCTPEIEIEIELDIETETYCPAEAEPDHSIHEEIVDYLNKRAGRGFSSKSVKTVKLINGRLKEGYTLDDFKKVIDVKVSDWGKKKRGQQDMRKFLRPATLFSKTNFENYMQEVQIYKNENTETDFLDGILGKPL